METITQNVSVETLAEAVNKLRRYLRNKDTEESKDDNKITVSLIVVDDNPKYLSIDREFMGNNSLDASLKFSEGGFIFSFNTKSYSYPDHFYSFDLSFRHGVKVYRLIQEYNRQLNDSQYKIPVVNPEIAYLSDNGELINVRMDEVENLELIEKLRNTSKQLSEVLIQRGYVVNQIAYHNLDGQEYHSVPTYWIDVKSAEGFDEVFVLILTPDSKLEIRNKYNLSIEAKIKLLEALVDYNLTAESRVAFTLDILK